MKQKIIPLLAGLMALSTGARATNLVVRSEGMFICGTNLIVAGKITVEDGGSMFISNATVNCQDFELEAGASLTATGTLSVAGYWINNSDFEKSAALDMPKGICSISDPNLATGLGDTDNDGISDHGEGCYDANSNGIADFIDPAQAEPCDSIPVEWLAAYGLPTDHSADLDDTDGDGASNWSEYHAMTDPGDSNSCLVITEYLADTSAAGNVTIAWNSVSTRTYDLVFGTNLNDSVPFFSSAEQGIAGQSGTTSVTVPKQSSDQGFYRIKVNP